MKILTLSEARPGERRRVAVGMFDGVHLGHREVIAGCESVLTFDPHPAAVVAPAHAPRLITDLPRKAQLLSALGVRELIVIPFDRGFAAKPARAFIEEVLLGALGAVHVSVGENFRFGHRAQGDPAMLQADRRFTTTVHALRELDGEIVSSSQIRGLVAAGEMAQARRFLGSPFELCGEVVSGDRRGRELGFPTANIVPQEQLACPGHGVYACIANGDRAAAVSIGVRPTFQTGRGELIEAHLLDFEGDLYATRLCLSFIERLRGERRFETARALVEQMHEDVRRTREIAAAAL